MRENSTKLHPDSSNIQGGKAKPEPELRQREIVRDSESSHVGFYIAKASPRRICVLPNRGKRGGGL